ncbi:MAG: V-type ATP synthase subunit C [Methanobrevibacter sp.]|jgi:V/A-type H+-transporting ATPase subunit C|nr:V-type ATP synthase subunit C [Candidatus Methanovirga basalitermitum]
MADELTAILTQFGIPNEIFLAIIVIVLLVVGAVVVIIVSRPVLDIYPYLLPNAKIRARKGRLFDTKEFSEIIEADDHKEITNYLRGFPDYAKHLDDHSIEKSLDIQLGETYELLSKIAPDDVGKVFTVLSKKSDIANIKSLIASIEANLSKDETIDLLIPVGSLYPTCEQLVDSNTIEDIVAGLDGTEYSSILEDALREYNENGMILPLESALDKYFLENLLSASSVPSDDNIRILHSYIGLQVDVANLKVIIRSKVDGLKYDSISPHIISNGYQIKEWKLKDLMESENVTSIVNGLEGTDYSSVLNEALGTYNETGSASVFEKALDEYIVTYATSLSLKNPLGIGPIIGYINKKEKEIKNLKIIVRAKRENNLEIADIQEMLI